MRAAWSRSKPAKLFSKANPNKSMRLGLRRSMAKRRETFMWNRRTLFNIFFGTYALALVTNEFLGLDQEFYIHNFPTAILYGLIFFAAGTAATVAVRHVPPFSALTRLRWIYFSAIGLLTLWVSVRMTETSLIELFDR